MELTASSPDEEWPFTTPPGSEAAMFIQWKGTDVCLDFYCPCGRSSHFDGESAYKLLCPGCGSVFELGTQVILRRLSKDDGTAKILDLNEWDVQ